MEKTKLTQLKLTAAKARLLAVEMVHDAASGHPGGSLSCIDVLTDLYFSQMHVDTKNPQDPDRDRFVMSKGHCSPALYPILALRGFFPVENLKMFRRIDGHMSGHVEMHYNPGVDMSTGSLGQGISVAVGMALAGKQRRRTYRVYAILGDGELAEGQVWEAAMAANKFHLDNLCAVVDLNGLQIDGTTEDVMPTEPVDQKFESFGWHVVKINGHDFAQIDKAFEEARPQRASPPSSSRRPSRARASASWKIRPAGTARPRTTSSLHRPRPSWKLRSRNWRVKTWRKKLQPEKPTARRLPR